MTDEQIKAHLDLQKKYAYGEDDTVVLDDLQKEMDMYDWEGFANKSKYEKKCECGVDTLGYGMHSHYCPKAEASK